MRTTLPSGTAVEIVRPSEGTATPAALVVVPDIMGLRPLFDDHVARLSGELGWAVAAFEPFPGQEHLSVESRLGAMPTMDERRWVDDAIATADLLGAAPDATCILGFCMGGMVTIKAAATGRFHRGVPFYGMIRNPASWAGETNTDAMDAVLAAPGTAERILAIVGTNDPYTPPDHVAELEAAGATVVRYEGAEHGFVHDASRPAHRAEDAADAWRRTFDWLRG